TVSGSETGTVGMDAQGRRTAILGNWQDFPDILAAGPLSFAKDFPVAITRPSALPSETRNVLQSLDIDRVIIVGGTTAVNESVATEVRSLNGSIKVDRLAGTGNESNRFGTAVAIADFAYGELGFDTSHVELARSNDFADALAGGPKAGVDRAPIVLTTPAPLNPTTRAFLLARACGLRFGHIFGGFAAIAAETEIDAEDTVRSADCLQAGPATPTATIGIQPTDAATAVVTANPDTTTVDDRTFTLDGLIAGETYRITLVKCENVTGTGRNATFVAEPAAGSSTGFAAVTGNPTTDITFVNGTPNNVDSNATVDGVQRGSTTFVATGTTANFTIDGDTAECVVPVVYFDSTSANPNAGGAITRLEVTQAGVPAEDFNVGGRTTFVNGPTPPVVDQTPATATVAVAMDVLSDDDSLTVTFDEPVTGEGTYLLRDADGLLVAEYAVESVEGSTVTLVLVAGEADFSARDDASFTLQVLNERNAAGLQTNASLPVDETGTEPEGLEDGQGVINQDGMIFESLQAAEDASAPGDVLTALGAFTEGVLVDVAGLVINSEGAELTGGFIIAADDVEVNDFTILGGTDSGVSGEPRPTAVYITGGADGVVVDGNTITFDPEASALGIVTAPDGGSATIRNNSINNGDLGIYLQGPGTFEVLNNTVTGTSAEGISDDVDGTVNIEGNTFTDNTGTALALFRDGATVTGNTFDGSADPQVSDSGANYEAADDVSLEDILAANTFLEDAQVVRAGGDSGPGAIVTSVS
ncbi:MAG: putative cell wall binding repeat 2-containing protein, partial [Thermoleophilia bacterium]|nr:putative cell wall binding repeat 2-containing protein [Thermoleophilia bacterium]